MPYFCARLLIICLVDDGKPRKKNLNDHPFVFIRAKGYKEAFRRALVWGKRKETHYKNYRGQRVRWAFVRVEEVKRLPSRLDGAEVGSLLDYLVSDSPVSYDRRFRPRLSAPLFTE